MNACELLVGRRGRGHEESKWPVRVVIMAVQMHPTKQPDWLDEF